MGSIKSLIEKHIPDVYVHSLMIGNNVIEVSAMLGYTLETSFDVFFFS